MVDMNEPKWLSPVERDAWLALVSVTTLLPAALDSELQVQAKITLFDYNVLAMLSEAPERILAMSELASRTSASLSRLSHVVKKLEGRGWVQRSRSPEDARVTIAQLSDEGWEMVQTLAPEHVGSVRQLIFQGLDEADIAELARIGQKLVGRLDPDHWILR
ncbi:MarR family transcriptional regulator [Paeniglutamicibacter gangotriensis Lz1y]|uniref:MarR family transcriptional regulator n=2 Tax=Paeniglutamicibacter gangotriensis TaxID=254787 RepID=M7NAI7_9MICC|nr:MarR family transcriptional regulator [Paeniglutamicibacter gangotriensis Lz1y]